MVESILSFLDEFGRTFRFVDAADIVLVSVFLYSGLLWFQQTASRGVLLGVSALALVYFIAQGLDMYLTSLAFHATFAVLLFVLAIVFQEDLRRMFERLSSLRSVRIRRTPDVDINLDELVESVFYLSGSKTGALIVIQGKEPLERHLNGGVRLGGRVSKQLLYSIFDAHTPGHDGAVVVDNNTVTQFAAHLPISKNVREIAGRGTRHSAGLGLSERSDAFVIIVSEERSVVSVAESGKLHEMPTAGDLKRRLDRFLAATFPTSTQPFWKRFLVQNMRLKIIALIVAVVAWFVLAYDPSTVQRTFVGVPIEYHNLPEQLILDEGAPSEARITLSGSERHFRFFEPGSLKVSLDLTDAVIGFQEFTISDRNIRVPSNLSPYRVEPRIIFLNLAEKPADVEGGETVRPSEDPL